MRSPALIVGLVTVMVWAETGTELANTNEAITIRFRMPRSILAPLTPPERQLMATVSIKVNGKVRKQSVDPRVLLVHFLREQLRLTGTHIGCDTSQCGACTVLIDGRSAKSCTIFAVQADGSEITTIEGLAKDGQLHPLQ